MKVKLFMIVYCSLLLFSCKHFLDNNETSKKTPVEGKKAYVKFSVGDTFSRSVLPLQVTEEDFSYELIGILDNEPETLGNWLSFEEMQQFFAKEIEIIFGDWTFILNAKRNDTIALTDSITKSIQVGSNSVIFELEEAENGTGIVNVIYYFPKDSFSKVTAVLYPLENNGQEAISEEILDIDTNIIFFDPYDIEKIIDYDDDYQFYSVSYNKSVPAGDYLLKFYDYQNENDINWINFKIEYVHIAPENTSNGKLLTLPGEVNSIYTISYESPVFNLKPQTSLVTSYNPFQTIKLPEAEDFDLPENVFFNGWHEKTDATRTNIFELPLGTTGDKAFVADFVNVVSVSELDNLLKKYEGSDVAVYISDVNPDLYSIKCCLQDNELTNVYLDLRSCTELLELDTAPMGNNLRYCNNLRGIHLPDSVEYIESGAFSGCSGLVEMTIPFVGISKNAYSEEDSFFGSIFGTYEFEGSIRTKSFQLGSHSYDPYVSYYIPDCLKTVNVTGGEIKKAAFDSCSVIEKITLPDEITYIGEYAFHNCSQLSIINIPNSISSIGKGVFYNCLELTEMDIPNNVTSIEPHTFDGCSKLRRVSIPDGITLIGDYAFNECSKLKEFKIPPLVTKIGEDAFYKCSNFRGELIIPSSVKGVASGAFAFCTGITSVIVSDGVQYLSGSAFSHCSNLTTLTIMGRMNSIGSYAFSECNNLSDVYISSINDWCNITFGNKEGNPLYYAKHLYSYINGRKTNIGLDITLDSSVTKIGDYAFCGFGSIGYITISDSVKSIGKYAFYNCKNLRSLKLGYDVEEIGEYAFYGCSSLEKLEFPYVYTSDNYGTWHGVKVIGDYAFYGCSSIRNSIYITKTITEIGKYAFGDCTKIKIVHFDDPDTWYVSTSRDNKRQKQLFNIKVSDFQNADDLKGQYVNYYWFKIK